MYFSENNVSNRKEPLMNFHLKHALLSAACLSAVLLAGCSSHSSPALSSGRPEQQKIIKIGVFEPLTGENGSGGFHETLGIRYANLAHPTVKIGEDTYTVQLVEMDTKSDKSQAETVARRLVNEKVSIVLGSYGSDVSIAAGKIFKEAEIPAIGASFSNTNVTLDNDYYFRISFLDSFQGTALANYAIDHQYRTAALISQTGSQYSAGLGTCFRDAFQHLGGVVLTEEYFMTGQTDFKDIMETIRELDPDVIFASSSIAVAPLLLRQARDAGITAPIASGDRWENTAVIENSGGLAEGIIYSACFDESTPVSREAETFITGFRAYLRDHKQPDMIPSVSALGYDAYLCAVRAIESAGATDPKAIRNALQNILIDGCTGPISFDQHGDARRNTAFIKTVKDGRFQYVTTTSAK